MKVMTDGNGYVENYVIVGGCPAGATEVEQPTDFDTLYYNAYKLENGVLILDETRLAEIKAEEAKDDLRQQRSRICFPIINRGELWYNSLTSAQVTELSEWYQSWLDVTETKKVPDMPEWIK